MLSRRPSCSLVPPALPVLASVILLAAYLTGASGLYHGILQFWLVQYNEIPFLDAAGIVSSAECERLGYNTYLENPCDPLGRPLVYPPSWKLVALFPVTYPESVPVFGILFSLAFLGALFLLPRAENLRDGFVLALAMMAPPVGWALVGGSNDMLIFALASSGLWLLGKGSRASLAGYSLFLIAGVLKYFPFVLLIIAAREKPKRIAKLAGASLVTLLFLAALGWGEWKFAFANVWNVSPFTYAYGAENIGAILSRLGLFDRSIADIMKWPLAALIVLLAWVCSRSLVIRSSLSTLNKIEQTFLVGGAFMVVTTYLLTQNLSYRQILLLLPLAGLLKIARYKRGHVLQWLPYLCLFSMYSFFIRGHVGSIGGNGSVWWALTNLFAVYAREVVWLVLSTSFLAIVIAWLRDSQIGRELIARLPPRLAAAI